MIKARTAACALGAALASCTPISGTRPIIDLEGVDMVKHNRDLAACEDYVSSQLFSPGNGVSRCMHEKGYKILRWN